jgi:putative hydrolase of the HAD superfamily
MLPKAIFFDMDDTLLRCDTTLELAWKKACEISLRETKTFKSDELLHQIDIIREWYWSDPERHRSGRLNLLGARTAIVRMALEKLGCYDKKIADNIAASFSLITEGALGLYPNTENILGQLVKKKVKLALLTNGAGEAQREKIKRFGLSRYFPVCLIEGELGFGKPDRRVFEMALDKMAVKPQQTWMIGDDLERDISGAQTSGIFSIWFDYREQGLPEGSLIVPDKIINNLGELLSL